MSKVPPGEGDPTSQLKPADKPMSDEELDRFIADNKRELYALRKCISNMPPKNQRALEYLHILYGGTYDDNAIEAFAAAGVTVEPDMEAYGLPNLDQIRPLADEGLAIIQKKLGIERDHAIKMMEALHQLP